MINRIVFRLGVTFSLSLSSNPYKHLKSAFPLFPQEHPVFFIPGFSQSFDHEFFCHPSFLIAFKCNSPRQFFFLFRITNTVSSLPTLRIECIKVTLTNLCLVVLISTDFYAFASNVVLVSIITKTGISSALSIRP